ncbi:MAG: aminotransferase class V-fold PLP-dependent enzyme, partial [Nannocystaceae bacterium]
NRTHLRDYESACTTGGAAAILWAHRSNFTQQGFVGEPSLPQLSALARRCDVPLIADLGSGNLHSEGAGADEPTVAEILAGESGAGVVTCSGDKLLGGPQAGILAGKRAWIERCRRHPMARALRIDKVSLAALHATLAIHATRPEARTQVLPLDAAATATVDQLRARAETIVNALNWPEACITEVLDTIGGKIHPVAYMNIAAFLQKA